MVKNSTLQKIINLNEEELNKKIVEKAKLELLISNINKSIELIKNSLAQEQSKVRNDDLNMIRSFSKYREICSIKIKFLKDELLAKENDLEGLVLQIKETYIEKEKFNLVLQKNILKHRKEQEKKENSLLDEINTRSFVTKYGG